MAGVVQARAGGHGVILLDLLSVDEKTVDDTGCAAMHALMQLVVRDQRLRPMRTARTGCCTGGSAGVEVGQV